MIAGETDADAGAGAGAGELLSSLSLCG